MAGLYAPSRPPPLRSHPAPLGPHAMPTAIPLIRGINVGSTRSLPMQLLRHLCEQVGMHEPRTLIQSGNVVFQAPVRGLTRLAGQLELAIESSCGFRPAVILRTPGELAAAIDANPFASR